MRILLVKLVVKCGLAFEERLHLIIAQGAIGCKSYGKNSEKSMVGIAAGS